MATHASTLNDFSPIQFFQRPAFVPHRLLPSGHMQTVAAVWLPSQKYPYRARQHHVALADGDRLVLHDDCPSPWQSGNRVTVLIHGLMGCYQSHYMVRLSARLAERGVRVFRLDLRGSGAGVLLAKRPFHSACIDDVTAALSQVAELCPDSPLALAGFSLGGNILLRLLGEIGEKLPAPIDRACAVCPPIDLPRCSANLERGWSRLYDRHFLRGSLRRLAEKRRYVEGFAAASFARPPKTMRELDHHYTAPLWGFGTADNYYRQASALPLMDCIRVPSAIVTADDDPIVPVEMFDRAAWPCVEVHVTRGGGHLGFIGAGGSDSDRRWLDWRMVQWATALRPGSNGARESGASSRQLTQAEARQ